MKKIIVLFLVLLSTGLSSPPVILRNDNQAQTYSVTAKIVGNIKPNDLDEGDAVDIQLANKQTKRVRIISYVPYPYAGAEIKARGNKDHNALYGTMRQAYGNWQKILAFVGGDKQFFVVDEDIFNLAHPNYQKTKKPWGSDARALQIWLLEKMENGWLRGYGAFFSVRAKILDKDAVGGKIMLIDNLGKEQQYEILEKLSADNLSMYEKTDGAILIKYDRYGDEQDVSKDISKQGMAFYAHLKKDYGNTDHNAIFYRGKDDKDIYITFTTHTYRVKGEALYQRGG